MANMDLDFAPAPASAPSALVMDLDFGQGDQAKTALTVGAQENPEQAAKLRQLSKQTGIDPELIKADPKQVEADAALEQGKSIVDGSPHLTNLLNEKPEVASVIHDDLGPLAQLGKSYSDLSPAAAWGESIGRNFGLGAKSAVVSQELGRQGSKLAIQRDIGEDSSQTLAKIKDLQLESKHFPDNPGVLSATGLGSVVGGIVDSINHSLPIFLGATGAGALAGSGVGGVGAVPGAAAGATYGLIHGMAADQAKVIAGHAYLALDAARDDNSKPLPELAKQGGAVVAGVGGYLFNTLGGWHLEGFAKESLTRMFGETVTDTVTKNPSVAATVGTALKSIGESAATGGGIMAGQQAVTSTADALTKVFGGYSTGGTFENLFNNKDELIKATHATMAAFVDGATLMALTRVPAAGTNMVADLSRIGAARDYQAKLDNAYAQAQASATIQRDPEILKDYLTGINNQKVYVPAEVVGQLYHGTADGVGHLMAPGSGPLGYIKDLAEQYRSASAHGGDIEIPLADYFAHTAPEVHEQLKDHIREQPQALTAQEAANLETNPPNYWESLEHQTPGHQEQLRQNVEEAKANLAGHQEVLADPAKADLHEASAAVIPHLEQYIAENEKAIVPRAEGLEPKVDSETGRMIHQNLAVQVDTERQNMWLSPMFKTPQAAGMSVRQFKFYSDHLQEVQRKITEGVYKAVDKEITRRETKLWNDAVSKEVENVSAEKEQEPVHFADSHLRTGRAPNGEKLDGDIRIKLDPNAVDVMYDGTVSAREGMNDQWFSSKGGWHPDDAASIFGFSSGKEMMDALASLESDRRASGQGPKKYFDGLVKAEAQSRVEQKLGKLDERILNEALEAALDVKQIDVLIDEMSRLGQDTPISKEAVQKHVEETHAGMSAEQGRNVAGFERLTGKFGREAEMALLKGDYAAAFQAKQNQLINFMLAKQAKAFDREMTRLESTLEKFGDNVTLHSVKQEYTDQIHLLMRAVDEKIPRSDENLEQAVGKTTVGDFVTEKENKVAAKFAVADWLRQEVPTSLKNMNVDQARDFKKAIDSLEFNGREEAKVMHGEQAEALEKVTQHIADNLKEATGGKEIDWESTGTKTLTEDGRAVVRLMDSELLKVEQMAQWWDLKDPTGPFNTYVIRPLKEAQHWRDDKVAEIGKKISSLFSKEVSGRLAENVPQTLLLDRKGRPQKLNRGNIIMMALNLGSESNLEVLAKGRNWDPEVVKQVVRNTLTPEEVKFVNGLHQIYADLWPHVQRVTKELTGVAIERVTPVRNGDLTGGYFPLMRDIPLSDAVGKGDRTDAFFDQRTFDPFADASALHSRTGATYPLDLTFTQLPWKLRELVHGIAYRIPVREAAKIINDKTVIGAISDGMGREYYDQLNPWLHYISRDGNTEDLRLGFSTWQRWAMEARSNSIVATIGLRGSTTLIHTAIGALNSIGETGPLEFGKASGKLVFDLMRGDLSRIKQIYEESGEIRNAAHNLDRDLGAQRDKMLGENKLGLARRSAMLLETSVISALYTMSAIPTYMAAKEMHLKQGLSNADAIYAADQVLRNAHGSSGAMDLAAISRNPVMKNFTMFYQTFNHIYNRQRSLARDVGADGPRAFGKLVFNTTMYVLLPALIHGAVNEPMKEDDNPGSWFAKQVIGNEAATVPLARDIIYGIEHGRAAADSPLSGLIRSVVNVSKDIHHTIDGDDAPKWVEHAAEFFAFLTGVGTKSTSKILQGGADVKNGVINPADIDMKGLLLRGDVKEKAE